MNKEGFGGKAKRKKDHKQDITHRWEDNIKMGLREPG
jgi:hypothetical protein